MDCSLLGSSVIGIFQARILEWVATSSSRGSSRPRDLTWVSCIGTWFLFTTEAPAKPLCTFLFSLPSCVQLFVTPWIAARLPCPSLCPGVCSNSCALSRWCYLTISSSATLFSFCLQSFPASGFFFFSNELSVHIRWPKYWSFSFSISPSSEYSGLVFLSIDWFALLTLQGTLKSPPTDLLLIWSDIGWVGWMASLP